VPVASSPVLPPEQLTADVTCLGCGCACDDIGVVVRDGRITEARNACDRGVAWFGDGQTPADASLAGREAAREEGMRAAVGLVASARRPLVYLAPGLSCEAQREGVALADALHAALDTITSSTAMGSILAAQERGRASATLGEARHRADVVVCWGVDPLVAHPRFWTRYAPMPAGLQVPDGRRSRTVVAVDVGDLAGPADVDRRFAIPPDDEIATLTALRTLANAGRAGEPTSHEPSTSTDPIAAAIWARARALLPTLLAGRYVLLVADAEHAPAGQSTAEPARLSALIALAQALNGPTRCALTLLRGGGNRNGADAVLTSQTGYPAAVDFSRGYPRYRPHDGTAMALAARGDIDAVIVIGSADSLPTELTSLVARLPGVVIGPCATQSALAAHHVAIDTGLAGVHDEGTALRLDDVPLPLRPVLTGPPSAASVVSALRTQVVTRPQARFQGTRRAE
jgi:formylmethanofuran dehydrogenase subunit B